MTWNKLSPKIGIDRKIADRKKIIINKENTNSYKRELQIMHIKMLSDMLYKVDSMPSDAISFGRSSLNQILKDIYFSMSNNSLDYYTKSHLEYCSKLIETVLDPKIQIN